MYLLIIWFVIITVNEVAHICITIGSGLRAKRVHYNGLGTFDFSAAKWTASATIRILKHSALFSDLTSPFL